MYKDGRNESIRMIGMKFIGKEGSIYLFRVFDLYSAMGNVRSAVGNIRSAVGNVHTALRNINQ